MTEPTVQVPVSLVQQTVLALRQGTPQSTRRARGEALHALLSQPTPSVYRCNGDAGCADGFADGQGHSLQCAIDNRTQPSPSAELNLTERLAELRQTVNGHRPYCLSNQPGDGACNCDMVAPPSIADIAPGTTFRVESPLISPADLWTVRLNEVDREKHALSTTGYNWMLDDIDPSTIRSVTPPPATPGVPRG